MYSLPLDLSQSFAWTETLRPLQAGTFWLTALPMAASGKSDVQQPMHSSLKLKRVLPSIISGATSMSEYLELLELFLLFQNLQLQYLREDVT